MLLLLLVRLLISTIYKIPVFMIIRKSIIVIVKFLIQACADLEKNMLRLKKKNRKKEQNCFYYLAKM